MIRTAPIAGFVVILASILLAGTAKSAGLDYEVSWIGNSFSGAEGKWVQNFFIHMNARPDGSVVTWSHWDEGGKRFGVYKDGSVVGNRDERANSLMATDKQGHVWDLTVEYTDPKYNEFDFVPKGITRDGEKVEFPGLYQPTALAIANDGSLMVADSGTGPRQQILFYDVTKPGAPRLARTFGDQGGISSGTPGVVTPTKFWGIRGVGMDRDGNIYVALSENGGRPAEVRTGWGTRLGGLRTFLRRCRLRRPLDRRRRRVGRPGALQDGLRTARPASSRDGSVTRSIATNTRMTLGGLTFVKQQGEHGLTSPQVVHLEGKRFLFVGGMFASNFIGIFRYDGEIAAPSGLILQWDNALYRTDLVWPPNKPKGTSIWRARQRRWRLPGRRIRPEHGEGQARAVLGGSEG